MSTMPAVPPVSTARKVFALLFYAAAGFAVYTTVLMAFFMGSGLNHQLRATVPSAVVTVVLLLIAIALNPRWRWQRMTAFALLGGGGYIVVVIGIHAFAAGKRLSFSLWRGPSDDVIGYVLLAAVLVAAVVLLLWRTTPLQDPPAR